MQWLALVLFIVAALLVASSVYFYKKTLKKAYAYWALLGIGLMIVFLFIYAYYAILIYE